MRKKPVIQSISLTRMNNGAHFMFMKQILKHALADACIEAKCAKLVENLQAAVEKEDADLKISQKSMLTDAIAAADKERDIYYQIYKKNVQGLMKIPQYAKDGKVLNQHLKDYSITPNMQMDRETGMLLNFLNDLETKFPNEVEHLHLTPLVNGLKAANERVCTSIDERTEERKGIPVGSLKASREVSDEAYETLISAVNLLAKSDEGAEFQSFIDYVNTEVVHYKRQVLKSKADPALVSMNALTEEGSDDEEDALPAETE